MKTKIATAISIVGVLGAGSAAALVNTQILDNGPSESGASAAVLPEPSSIDLTLPENPVQTVPVSTVATTTVPLAAMAEIALPETTTTTVAAPSGFLTAYNVGDAGVVTVDVVDGRLVLVSAEPKPGWTVTKAEDDSNDESDEVENEVEVTFSSPTVRVEFEAELVDGVIVPKVESRAIGGTTGQGATAAPAPTTRNTIDDDDDRYEDDDHDDDDRYEDDDHEDEDHSGSDEDDHEDERDDD